MARRLLLLLTVAALTGVPPAAPATASPVAGAPDDTPSVACTPRSEPIPDRPAALVDVVPAPGAEDRMVELTLDSPALGRRTKVNVLLPIDVEPGQRYPVLYLLHGASGSHRDWQTQGAVVQVVDDATAAHDLPPFIVVMPDAGAFGFYSDWYGLDVDGHNGSGPAPAWTTYHIDELIPWVDAHLPTIPTRRGRAVAGLSMGGFGTMSYATRFPDLFAAAGSFSGAVNPSWGYPLGNAFLTGASAAFTGAGFDQCIWGEFPSQEVRWLGADPTYLAGNLDDAGMSLYVASGGGDLDRPQGLATDPVEQAIYLMNREFVAALQDDGVPATVDFYAEGGHEWRFWQRGLAAFLPQMVQAFATADDQAPSRFDHASIEEAFSVWGWDVVVERDVTEFLYLTDVGHGGLTAVGSGTVHVTTPGIYPSGAVHHVGDGATTAEVVADADGRLRFAIDLGPSHTAQQTGFTDVETLGWSTTTVTISPV